LPADVAQNLDAIAGERFDVKIENGSHFGSLASSDVALAGA
jgi:2'-5' RNA ligase